MTPLVVQSLRKDPKFKYQDNPAITDIAAALFSRALFISDYFSECRPDPTVPIKIWSSSFYANPNINAATEGIFFLGNSLVEDLGQVAPKDMKNLRLEEVQVDFNMNGLGDAINKIETRAGELRKQGKSKEDVEKWKNHLIELQGIEQESIMVEEMAHAYYIMQAARDPGKLEACIKEILQYPRADPNLEKPLAASEFKARMDSPIEQDGVKWVDTFMRCYYADMVGTKDDHYRPCCAKGGYG